MVDLPSPFLEQIPQGDKEYLDADGRPIPVWVPPAPDVLTGDQKIADNQARVSQIMDRITAIENRMGALEARVDYIVNKLSAH